MIEVDRVDVVDPTRITKADARRAGFPDADAVPMDDHAPIRHHAARMRERLPATILPYWLEASRADEFGGCLLHDDVLRSPARRVGRVVPRIERLDGRVPRSPRRGQAGRGV